MLNLSKEDLPLLIEWLNTPEFSGEFVWFPQQQSRTEWAKRYDNLTPDHKWFFIEKKDGTKIGIIGHFLH
jgi:RimJ/RimL family protein N-acetyltransferase